MRCGVNLELSGLPLNGGHFVLRLTNLVLRYCIYHPPVIHKLTPILSSFLDPVFIQELTSRSHLNSLSSRRRTLSRPDVAQAISKSDIFDFLIDIVPREGEEAGEEEAGENGEEEEARGVGGGKGKGRKTGRGKGKAKRGRGDEMLNQRHAGISGIVDVVGLERGGGIEFGENVEGAELIGHLENVEGGASKRIRIDEGLTEDYRVVTNSSVCFDRFSFFWALRQGI